MATKRKRPRRFLNGYEHSSYVWGTCVWGTVGPSKTIEPCYLMTQEEARKEAKRMPPDACVFELVLLPMPAKPVKR